MSPPFPSLPAVAPTVGLATTASPPPPTGAIESPALPIVPEPAIGLLGGLALLLMLRRIRHGSR